MPGDATGILAVPWLMGAAAAMFVVAILLTIKRAGGVALIPSLFGVGLIAAALPRLSSRLLQCWNCYLRFGGGSAYPAG
jgi:hypothetical protein